MEVSSNAEASTSSSLYRFYSTDDHGSLRISHPHQEGEVLLQVAATKKNAVHKMARGTLSNGVEIVSVPVKQVLLTTSAEPCSPLKARLGTTKRTH
jgi:hypothetical protein